MTAPTGLRATSLHSGSQSPTRTEQDGPIQWIDRAIQDLYSTPQSSPHVQNGPPLPERREWQPLDDELDIWLDDLADETF